MTYTVIRFRGKYNYKRCYTLTEAMSEVGEMDIIYYQEEGVAKRLDSRGRKLSNSQSDAWYDMRNSQREINDE